MIPAIIQTLTEMLKENSPLIKAVNIDLNHPETRQDIRPALSLYLYELNRSQLHPQKNQPAQFDTENFIIDWYDLSFVIIPWDWTVLGQCQLLSEVLKSLIPNQSIAQEKLAPELRGFGDLTLRIATSVPDKRWDLTRAWLRFPALFITVRTPFVIAKFPP